MLAKFTIWFQFALDAFGDNVRWMSWNLYLALIPLGVSIWLFQQARSRSMMWWLGLLTFVLFLPNAPYVLTDTIHLIQDIREQASVWIITLVVIPQYILFLLIGFEAYVLSLLNFGDYLKRHNLSHWILGMELSLHGLSAIGIYLGRFLRFNSWDVLARPRSLTDVIVNDLLEHQPLLVMALTAMVLTGLYWLTKQLNLAIFVYVKSLRLGSSKARMG